MAPRLGFAWRLMALAGMALGLGLSPLASGAPPLTPVALLFGAALLIACRPRWAGTSAAAWLVALASVAGLAGLMAGAARLDAIDSSQLDAQAGSYLGVTGTVASPPRLVGDRFRFALATPDGRVAVESATIDGLDEGTEATVSGTVAEPDPFERSAIERLGCASLVVADSVVATGDRRGGVRGALDDVRRRAEAALSRGTPPPSSALMRGFVLGQDDLIAEDVRDDFRRSGLAHVLAVSGQNVMLLAILATPILALLGVPLRARLIALVLIIAIYVPVAGAGASIQRAGVMGAAGMVAALSGRPRASWYALALAAAATLAVDPRATADIGWQLSFAAVAGLLVLAGPLARALGAERHGPARRALIEGAAMTLAATLATGPLAAHHFGTVSLTAIPANLLALPAIAPAMWLGMLAGALGQIPGAPVEPLTWLGGLCAGFIGWVAHALGPAGAQLDIPEPGPLAAVITTVAMLGTTRVACEWLARRRSMAAKWRFGRARMAALACAVSAICVAPLFLATVRSGEGPAGNVRLEIRFLDVGQGDAILVTPRRSDPLLVDTGPPEAEVWERLDELGVDRLAAIAITHDERDHSGGLQGVLTRVETSTLLFGSSLPRTCEVTGCPPSRPLGAGDSLELGSARVDVLWPPPGREAGDDPNATALVLRVTSGEFDALLTGDAESEIAPYRPSPVEVLKLAHHGSADAGLDRMLDLASPELAVASVGAGNPFGHPTVVTLADLAAHGVPLVRTDESGEVVIEVRGDRWSVG